MEEFLDGLGFQQGDVGGPRQVLEQGSVSTAGVELRSRGQHKMFNGVCGPLRHWIEHANLLEGIAKEIEAVGPQRGDGVDVYDAATDGVLPGGFADRLAVVIVRAKQIEEAL